MSLFDVAFAQPHLLERLQAMQATVAFTIGLLVASRSYGSFYREQAAVLCSLQGRGVPWWAESFQWIRWGLFGLCGVLMLCPLLPGLLGVLGLCFAMLDRFVASMAPSAPNNTFHVHLFGAGTFMGAVFLDMGRPDLASFALTVMQLQVGLLYALAGLSKFRVSGFQWFRGRTLRAMVGFRGTTLGRRLFASPRVSAVASASSVVLEAAVLPAIVWQPAQPWIAVALFGFHAGVFVVLRIPFWHLWVFFPALFLL